MDELIREAERIANGLGEAEKVLDSILQPKLPQPTHCFEMLMNLTRNETYEILKGNYIVDGLEAIVLDKATGIKYGLTIKPLEGK